MASPRHQSLYGERIPVVRICEVRVKSCRMFPAAEPTRPSWVGPAVESRIAESTVSECASPGTWVSSEAAQTIVPAMPTRTNVSVVDSVSTYTGPTAVAREAVIAAKVSSVRNAFHGSGSVDYVVRFISVILVGAVTVIDDFLLSSGRRQTMVAL